MKYKYRVKKAFKYALSIELTKTYEPDDIIPLTLAEGKSLAKSGHVFPEPFKPAQATLEEAVKEQPFKSKDKYRLKKKKDRGF